MANLITIDHGQANWDKAENSNFSDLNKELTEIISDTGWVTEGITLLNGTEVVDGANDSLPMFRKLTVKSDFKTSSIVSIRATIKNCQVDTPIISFPDILRTNDSKADAFSFGTVQYTATLWNNPNAQPTLRLSQLWNSMTNITDRLQIAATFMY